jgi:hypothetical protein
MHTRRAPERIGCSHTRLNAIRKNRSRSRNLGRGPFRFKTASCWRKAKFSEATC